MSDLDTIIDKSGTIRRCGTKPNPEGFSTKLKMYSDSGHPMFTDDQIKTILADPDRVASRVRFDSSWILDQLQHGSCEGHAEAAALARTRVRRGLSKVLLSGAYAYSKVNGGQDNGAVLEDGLAAIQKYGICPLSLVSANMIYPRLQPANADAEALKHKALVAYALPDSQSLKSALAAGFDCVVAVMVGNRFATLNGDGVCGADNGPGNHAVCVDDLRFVNGVWLFDMPNSWNVSFGQQGRGYLLEQHFVQTRPGNTFYALASSEESDDE